MAGAGRVKIVDRDGGQGDDIARVVGGRLLVQGLGGGGGGPVTIIAPLPLPIDIFAQSLASVSVDDAGGLLSVDDGGGSLTVDGTVAISNFPASQTVDDGGLSLTVDGTVAVSNFPAVQSVDDNGGFLSVDDGGGSLTVDGTVAVSSSVAAVSVVDAGNSTIIPLGGGGNFTGVGVDLLGYRIVTVTLATDKDSAADGMTFQFSTDNVNWDDTYLFTMTGGETRRFQFPITARYFRVNYTTAAGAPGAQVFFRVQTILHPFNALTSIHRLDDDTDPDRSAQLMKSAIIAQINGVGDFVAVNSNGSGHLLVAPGNVQVLGADVDFTNPLPVTLVDNKIPFTGSTNGRPIPIAVIVTPGTLIHTSIAANRDIMTMWATNRTTLDRRLTVEFGGVVAGDQQVFFIPSQETVIILDEAPIQNALVVRAFLDGAANSVNVFGYYRRESSV